MAANRKYRFFAFMMVYCKAKWKWRFSKKKLIFFMDIFCYTKEVEVFAEFMLNALSAYCNIFGKLKKGNTGSRKWKCDPQKTRACAGVPHNELDQPKVRLASHKLLQSTKMRTRSTFFHFSFHLVQFLHFYALC